MYICMFWVATSLTLLGVACPFVHAGASPIAQTDGRSNQLFRRLVGDTSERTASLKSDGPAARLTKLLNGALLNVMLRIDELSSALSA